MQDQTGKDIAVWDLQLDRKFLSQSDSANERMKAEFSSLTENPSLPELFAQIAKPMVDANVKLLTILHPDLTDVCRNAVEFDELFGGRPGTRALAHTQSPELKAGMRIGFSSWPIQLIECASQSLESAAQWRAAVICDTRCSAPGAEPIALPETLSRLPS